MDRNKLRQVLLNLTDNAKQAMPDGGVLSIGLTSPSTDWATVTVRDTGCGIAEQKLEHIFDAFYSTRREGTGLGLAIVKQIIDAVDGTVTVDSVVGEGTCFTIGLPGGTPARQVASQSQAGISKSEANQ
jgi:signal transduction histidine kinase